MTVQTNTNVASFNGNGVTQIFPIAFKFNNDTDLVVLLVDDATGSASLLTLNSDYTVSGEGDEEGGLINVVVAPASGKRLKVTRVVDILQLTDLRPGYRRSLSVPIRFYLSMLLVIRRS